MGNLSVADFLYSTPRRTVVTKREASEPQPLTEDPVSHFMNIVTTLVPPFRFSGVPVQYYHFGVLEKASVVDTF